jgi:hypothetical protein
VIVGSFTRNLAGYTLKVTWQGVFGSTIPRTVGFGRVQVCMISLRLKKVSSTFTTKQKVKEHGCITRMKSPIHISIHTKRVHSSNECKRCSAIKKLLLKKLVYLQDILNYRTILL